MSEHSQEIALLVAFTRDLHLTTHGDLTFTGHGTLTSAFAVSELAAASFAAVGIAVSELIETIADATTPVTVDRNLACAWFGAAVRPVDWQLPSPWDPVAGDYRGLDGWIRLHTNAPHHKAAALGVLGLRASADVSRDEVAAAVESWRTEELETAVVAAGGCAARMHKAEDWARHPQGLSVAAEPIVIWRPGELVGQSAHWTPTAERPLEGLRVLDLTRVLAGPAATRLLAGFGADVLRVDPPDWNEPALVPEMTLGKRAARLDASTAEGIEVLEQLIAGADVIVSGYRPAALDGLVSRERRAELRPGLIEVAIDAYGWSGPWHDRRGFDSIVQMSSGIAAAGMSWTGAGKPTPLPVQALDYATGNLAAAAVLRALIRVRREKTSSSARLSLARVATELLATRGSDGAQAVELPTSRIDTPWGAADLLEPPLQAGDARLAWSTYGRDLGADAPAW